MVPHTRLRPPVSLASRRAAPPALAPAESSALRRWAHPTMFTGGSRCTALTWPPKPSRSDRGVRLPRRTRLPGVRCHRSRAARRHHLHPGAGHHAGGLTGHRHGHAGLVTWAGWCGVVPSAQATWLGLPVEPWRGPVEGHITVSGSSAAASGLALATRRPRLKRQAGLAQALIGRVRRMRCARCRRACLVAGRCCRHAHFRHDRALPARHRSLRPEHPCSDAAVPAYCAARRLGARSR